ncbi:MAG: RNA methyltransferase [Flavobacteriaceae bacterium]|nr:RNA methyltransferase [Bacteroidia bacterium]NNL16381.1 RNA methyltransferase [Flavobacteriaceae bacterium]
MNKHISSLQNPLVKQWITLKEKSRSRKRLGLFLVEGYREIRLAIKGGYEIESIIFNPELISIRKIHDLNIPVAEVIEVSSEVYQRIAYRETTQGLIAVSKSKDLSLKNLKQIDSIALILVAEAPEKPGNIGALLRTADAANLDAVIVANPLTDMYNPNIIRSSVGCLFTNNIAIGTTREIIQFLKNNNVKIFCAALDQSSKYHEQNYLNATAIVLGTEATGLSFEWLENSTKNIMIPMQGEIDSLNVSVAAGILIFEAKRQRDFN